MGTFAKKIEKLMEGAVDFHVHAGPDPYAERRFDLLELAVQARRYKMAGLVAKNHQFGTANLASLVNRIVKGVRIFGSIALNREVGGLNIDVVEAEIKAGAKVIWMPTSSSIIDSRDKKGISIIDENGDLVPVIKKIVNLIKKNGCVIGTGHLSIEEIYAIVREAKKTGTKITVTHPMTKGFGSELSLAQQKELVVLGAVIEHSFVACMPDLGGLDPKKMVHAILELGVENCILDTDMGQVTNPSPPEAFRSMIGVMLKKGLSYKDLEHLIKRNPKRLLNMEN